MNRASTKPIRMLGIIFLPFSDSSEEEVDFSGVSTLTKGVIISKFLGYLYSEGPSGIRVVKRDYPLPEGCLTYCVHFYNKLRSARKAVARCLGGRRAILDVDSVRKSSHFFFHVEPDRLREGSSASCLPSRKGQSPRIDEIQWVFTQSVEVRQFLMTMNTPGGPQGILVSLKQAEETLRKGRNTHEKNTHSAKAQD